MSVRSILGSRAGDVRTLAPDDTLRDAISMMGEARVGCIVVLEEATVSSACFPSAMS